MRSRTGLRYKALVVGAIVLGMSGVGIGASGAVTTTPTITVTPHTGLADRQIVTVTGTGFDSNALLATVECPAGAPDFTSCDTSTLNITNADTSGALSVTTTVRRLIAPAAGPSLDCAVAGACELVAADPTAVLARAAIAFDPKIPPILPKVKVLPSTGLRDHQLVAVSGSGFDAASFVDVEECLASDPTTCAFETDRQIITTQAGTFAAKTYAVERTFDTFDLAGNEQVVDCAKAATRCVIAVAGQFGGGGVPSTASLTFNPSVPAVKAKITVAPATGLGDLQDVTVKGSGFLPGATVNVEECSGDLGPCGTFPTNVTANFTGAFTTTYSARRRISTFTFLGLRVLDCAVPSAHCSIVATDNSQRGTASAALGFSAAKPNVLTAIVAQPALHLKDNQRVQVTFKGFSAYQPVTMIECTFKAIANQDSSYCDPNTALTTITPAVGGAPTATFFAKRTLEISDGLIDCATAATSCVLLATTNANIAGGFISVSGGPSAAARHPSARAAGAIPTSLNAPTLKAVATTNIPGVASTRLSFGP